MHMFLIHLLMQQNNCSLFPPINNNNIKWCLLLAIIHFICNDGDGFVRGWWEPLSILDIKPFVVVVVAPGVCHSCRPQNSSLVFTQVYKLTMSNWQQAVASHRYQSPPTKSKHESPLQQTYLTAIHRLNQPSESSKHAHFASLSVFVFDLND